MEANQLRIDNWVKLKLTGENVRVSQICKTGIKPEGQSEKGLMIPMDRFEPIPLTEEILLKCGFEASDFYKTHFFKYEKIDNNLRGDVFCFNIDRNTDLFNTGKTLSFSFRPFSLHLKHLHQLQNLYFAITGKELKIELC